MSLVPMLLQSCCARADGTLFGHPCGCPTAQLFWRWWEKEGTVPAGEDEEEWLAEQAPTVRDFWGEHEWFGPWWLERHAECGFYSWRDAAFGILAANLRPGLAYRVTVAVRRAPLWSEPGACFGLFGGDAIAELAPLEFEFTAADTWALLGAAAPTGFDPTGFTPGDLEPTERLLAEPARGWAYGAQVQAVEWIAPLP